MKRLAAVARYLIAALAALATAGFAYETAHYAVRGLGQGVIDAGTGAAVFGVITGVIVYDTSRDGA